MIPKLLFTFLFTLFSSILFFSCGERESQVNDKKQELTTEQCFDIAHDAYKKGQFEKAVEYYSKVIEIDPNSALVYYNRAQAHHELNNVVSELKDYSYAIELDSSYIEAYINRGALLDDNSNYSEAIADYKIALKLNPNDVIAIFNIGNSFFHMNLTDSACKYWHQAQSLGDTEVHIMIEKYCKNR